nr:DUF6538 domain-containing protein [Gluconacetobacter sacchari]
MLRVRGTTYHFRRIVPPALRAALNRREIWVSLKPATRMRPANALLCFTPEPLSYSLRPI